MAFHQGQTVVLKPGVAKQCTNDFNDQQCWPIPSGTRGVIQGTSQDPYLVRFFGCSDDVLCMEADLELPPP